MNKSQEMEVVYHLCSIMNKVQISLSFCAGGLETLCSHTSRTNESQKHNDCPLVCP